MSRRFSCRIPLSITAVVLLLAAPRASAEAQSTELGATPRPAEAGRKSPTLARVIGVFPGAGHMYAGETRKGFVYLGETVGMLMLSSLMVAGDCVADGGGYGEDNCSASLTSNAALLATFGIWGWSIYDAGRAANRTNVRRGLRVSMRLVPTMQRRSFSHTASAGVLVAFRLGLH